MTNSGKEKTDGTQWVETYAERLSRFDQEIWNYAEPAFREYKSATKCTKKRGW
jgi:metal-dependent amidase/aminoacylase/carboxypeptidase family protein